MESLAPFVLAFIVGAVVGSFLNVCIYRIPRGLSIVEPPSHCFRCLTPIRWFDNVPLISYPLLGGRCRHCGDRYSSRYFVIELLTACLATTLCWRFGLTPPLLLYFAFVASLIVISFIDLDELTIPDSITVPGTLVGLTGSAMAEAVGIRGMPSTLESALGIALGAGLAQAVALAYRRLGSSVGVGVGNAKLLAMIGAFLGWRGVLVCLVIGAFGILVVRNTAAVVADAPRSESPAGPFFAVGAVVALLFGAEVFAWFHYQ